MKNIWTTCIVTAFSVLAFLMPSGRTFAATGISDSANFFSPDAESKAKSIIDDIARKHHQQVYIETVLSVPDGTTYAQYTDERTRAARVDGVYVLIVKKGGHVHVGGRAGNRAPFTNDTRTQLARQIETDMRKGEANFDAALANAMTFISDVYNRGERQPGGTNAPRTNSTLPPSPPVNNSGRTSGGSGISTGGFFHNIWGWVCLGVGIWVIIGLVRSVMAGRGGGYGGGGPGYGGGGPGYGYGGGGYGGGFGGGGFGSSLLGGLFGAAAGSWLYDRFSGGSSAYGQQYPPTSGGYGGTNSGPSSPDWQGPSDTGQGYESSDAGGGADFGGGGGSDASSGADFGGGGDSGGGGGDFGGGGGGDFGGGGGDAGGGGDF